jgi:hypothetical protein
MARVKSMAHLRLQLEQKSTIYFFLILFQFQSVLYAKVRREKATRKGSIWQITDYKS